MKYSPQHVYHKRKGFSFGESLLATFVLAVGLIIVIKLFQVSISNSLFLRDATIASELAQEGVELVRNVRDNNFISGGTGFASFSSNRHCYIAVNSTSLNCFSAQSGTSQYYLTYSGGQYVSTSTPSRFRRYVYIEYTSGANPQAVVKSFVVWGGASLPPDTGSTANCTIQTQCVYTEALLTNWKS